MFKWFLSLIFIIFLLTIQGCVEEENSQSDISFVSHWKDDYISVNNNDISFKYKDLECEGKWVLKDGEEGLLSEEYIVSNNGKLSLKKGLLKDLKCNQNLECNDVLCKNNKYEIELDPEIREVIILIEENPTNDWNEFVSEFENLTGRIPKLQLMKQEDKRHLYKAELKESNKEFDYVIETISKEANFLGIYGVVYEEEPYEKLIIDEHIDLVNLTKDTSYNNTHILNLIRINEYPFDGKDELNNIIKDLNTDFIKIDIKPKFGNTPEVLCNKGGGYSGVCDPQIIDFIPEFDGMAYPEYANYIYQTGNWNGELSNLEENVGVLELSSYGGEVLFDGFNGVSLNLTNWAQLDYGGSTSVSGGQLELNSVGDGLGAKVISKSESFPFQIGANNCFTWDNVKVDLDDSVGTLTFNMNSSILGTEKNIFRIDNSVAYDYYFLGGTNVTICISSNGTSIESIHFNKTSVEPSESVTEYSWDLSSFGGNYEFGISYNLNLPGTVTTTIDGTYLQSPLVSFDEGNFTSSSIPSNSSAIYIDRIDWLGFNNVEYSYSSDNSTWSNWVNISTGTNASVVYTNYLRTRGQCINSICWGTYINVTWGYQVMPEPPEPNTNIICYLDGEPFDRKYEYQTNSNITCIGDGEKDICINLDAPGYGDDYICSNPANISYLVGDISSDNWTNDISDYLDFTLNTTQDVNVSLEKNGTEITLLEFNITGEDNSGYPNNLQCDASTDGTIDFSLPGNLTGNILHQSYLSDGTSEGNVLFSTAGSIIIKINMSSSDLTNILNNNGTMNISGGTANSESYDKIEFFHNMSEIDESNSIVDNQFVYEDFSIGDISGRWGGSYTVSIGEKVSTTCSAFCSAGGSCGDLDDTDSCGASMRSQDLDFTRFGSVFLRVELTAGDVNVDSPCPGDDRGSWSSSLSIRDKTTGTGVLSVKSGQDISIWEFRKVGSVIKTYDDGVYNNEVAFDFTHQYEVSISVSASCVATPGHSIGADGNAYLYYINATGITGERIGNFTWGNGTITSHQLANFTDNLTTAKLIWTENKPSGVEVNAFLSANNGSEDSWESVQNDITHVFTVSGVSLKYRFNVTGTGIQDEYGDLSEQGIVYDVRTIVVEGSLANITFDIGNDGTNDWEMNGTLLENESYVVNWSSSPIDSYMADNCQNSLDCLVEIKVSSDQPGSFNYEKIDQNQTIGKISISEINNITSYLVNNSFFPVRCYSDGLQGDTNFTNLDLRYIGEENISIFAYDQSDVTINDSRIISIRYSPYNRTSPNKISSFGVRIYHYDFNNVTPIGQVIGYCDYDNKSLGFCENASTPIWNYISQAETDDSDYLIRMPHISNQCVTLYVGNNVTQEGAIPLNENYQKILTNVGVGNSDGIYVWLNGTCNRTSIRKINMSFEFTALCSECVWPLQIGEPI